MINETDIEAFEYWNDPREDDLRYIDSFTQFDAYQEFSSTTAIYPQEKGLEYVALGLASEAGEFAGKVKKYIRDGTYDEDALISELGDVLWYLSQAATELEVYLSEVARENVDKLTDRLERGVLKGSGDNR